jgi:hypothetical protein
MLDVTDRIATLDWTLDEVKAHHLELNQQMNSLIEAVWALDAQQPATPSLAVA